MATKIAIVSGANSGIGKATTQQLIDKGVHVVMACRSIERGQHALEEVTTPETSSLAEVMQLDLSNQQSIRSFVETFEGKYNRLDILINNAATFNISQPNRILNDQDIDIVWATNHLGPFLLTHLLLNVLKATSGSRVINVSSEGLLAHPFLKIDFSDVNLDRHKNKYSVSYAYYQSKLAHVMFTYDLADKLKDVEEPVVNCIRVTAVALDDERIAQLHLNCCLVSLYKIKRRFSITPEKMAATYVAVALDDMYGEVTGRHISTKLKFVGSNKFSKNKENWDKLWALSLKQTGLEENSLA